MSTIGTLIWQKVGVVVVVAMTVLLGNLRTAAFEARPICAAATQEPAGFEMRISGRTSETLYQQIGVDVDSPSRPPETRDDPQLIAAIFARDPDVRFVYHRQISKWM